MDLTHNNIQHIYLNTAEKVASFQTLPRDVIILVEGNPIACDCDMYDFLRYLEGRMHPNVQNYFHIIPGNLTCQSPGWVQNIIVADIKSKSLKCEVLDPCPKQCTCWGKPHDRIFSIDCSYKNLSSIPNNIMSLPYYQLELNLTGNKLKRILSLADSGLINVPVTKLLLSDTNISNISLNELPSSIEVSKIILLSLQPSHMQTCATMINYKRISVFNDRYNNVIRRNYKIYKILKCNFEIDIRYFILYVSGFRIT